jgi:glutamine cyclotransferase
VVIAGKPGIIKHVKLSRTAHIINEKLNVINGMAHKRKQKVFFSFSQVSLLILCFF